jgi:hypothetical protein
VLSLVFVPAFMAMMDDIGRFIGRISKRVVSSGKDVEPPMREPAKVH